MCCRSFFFSDSSDIELRLSRSSRSRSAQLIYIPVRFCALAGFLPRLHTGNPSRFPDSKPDPCTVLPYSSHAADRLWTPSERLRSPRLGIGHALHGRRESLAGRRPDVFTLFGSDHSPRSSQFHIDGISPCLVVDNSSHLAPFAFRCPTPMTSVGSFLYGDYGTFSGGIARSSLRLSAL